MRKVSKKQAKGEREVKSWRVCPQDVALIPCNCEIPSHCTQQRTRTLAHTRTSSSSCEGRCIWTVKACKGR